ncbi:MAG TPA: hypothetical protein VFM02_00030, partial [Candidatus Paceibacterota bacterium]|nr:hypothetical protein [Candidatus Paceibacterota bacterium]
LAVISLISFALFANFSLGLTFGDVDVLSFTMSLALMISGPGKISFAERWYREDLLGIDSRTETFLLKSETPEVSEKTETEKTNTAKTQERKSEGRKE